VVNHHTTAQKLPEQLQYTAVRHLTPGLAEDVVIIQCVKALEWVHIHHPLAVVTTDEQLGFADGVMSTSTRSVVVAGRMAVAVKDWLQ
jgi:hypothetical protein